MAELIVKGKLVELLEEKMFNSEAMCPVIKVTDVLEIVEEQPTTTEADIRAKAIDEVFEFLKSKRGKRYMNVNLDDLEIKEYKKQLAEQLKGE